MGEMLRLDILSLGVFLWTLWLCPAWQVRKENYGFLNVVGLPIFFLFYLSGLFDPLPAVCRVELDFSEETEPRWQQAYQDPSAASISGGTQD